MKLKPLSQQVVVVTGASSGIGLVTARRAAKRGARVVLAARNEEALRYLEDEIRADGGEAVAVVADVGDEEEVEAIAQAAIETFGGFDTWINNAGVGIYGELLKVPTADSRRLFDTNFWGLVYGSLAAAKHLRQRATKRHGGAIVNGGSEVSERALILLGMYSASKHAVKGFTDALRMELEAADAPISVSLVKPAATDTPFPHHARNYLPNEPQLPSPIYAPDVVAEVILHCAETPVREIYAGGSAKMHAVQGSLCPRATDWMMENFYADKQQSNSPDDGRDALYGPTTGLSARGGSPHHVRESSLYVKSAMHSALTGAVIIGTGLALAALATTRRPS